MKALTNIAISLAKDTAISLARDNWLRSVRNLASNAKNKERNITGKEAARTGRGFIWFFFSNEDY